MDLTAKIMHTAEHIKPCADLRRTLPRYQAVVPVTMLPPGRSHAAVMETVDPVCDKLRKLPDFLLTIL